MPNVFVLALVNLYMIVLSPKSTALVCNVVLQSCYWLVYIFDKNAFSVLIANLNMLVPV